MVNRHLWFDEETQYPDTMLNIFNYSFTDPLIEFVESATFRLRAEEGSWLELTDTENQIITKQLEELRGHLIHKAEQGMKNITQAIGDLWASLPYLEDPVSGEWDINGQKNQAALPGENLNMCSDQNIGTWPQV
ncbi:hypothetical protein TWF594_010757 [Orbilia oligospora]|uniref:Uncharacterized protein n=1 Tax=Orbilia oligospora TaxID=2813651 RepID=A0A7C8JXH8_ORBOL|nr:hypothetical protein TWF703_004746 [Orbilia oligospora]KAF3149658.1 hypothetical protein TWF594_010757 [Orbilia oligospora]